MAGWLLALEGVGRMGYGFVSPLLWGMGMYRDLVRAGERNWSEWSSSKFNTAMLRMLLIFNT